MITKQEKDHARMKPTLETLMQSATEAYASAYAPYSHFHVGAAVLDEQGHVHTGCNVENAAYPSGSCAEEQAIGAMVVGGGRQIRDIVIIGRSDALITPCGACRQRIRELGDAQTRIHVCDVEEGLKQTFTIDEMLPHSFGPDNL
jgi:cytidine deaminase